MSWPALAALLLPRTANPREDGAVARVNHERGMMDRMRHDPVLRQDASPRDYNTGLVDWNEVENRGKSMSQKSYRRRSPQSSMALPPPSEFEDPTFEQAPGPARQPAGAGAALAANPWLAPALAAFLAPQEANTGEDAVVAEMREDMPPMGAMAGQMAPASSLDDAELDMVRVAAAQRRYAPKSIAPKSYRKKGGTPNASPVSPSVEIPAPAPAQVDQGIGPKDGLSGDDRVKQRLQEREMEGAGPYESFEDRFNKRFRPVKRR